MFIIFGTHYPENLVSEMTYTVSSGTLNSTIPYLSWKSDFKRMHNFPPQLNWVTALLKNTLVTEYA